MVGEPKVYKKRFRVNEIPPVARNEQQGGTIFLANEPLERPEKASRISVDHFDRRIAYTLGQATYHTAGIWSSCHRGSGSVLG